MRVLNIPNVEWVERRNGQEVTRTAPVTEVGIVAVETVNDYLCSTFLQRLHEMVSRIVPTVQRYRGMGLTIFYAIPNTYVRAHYRQHIQRVSPDIKKQERDRIDSCVQQLTLPPYHWKYHHGHCSCHFKTQMCLPPTEKSVAHLHPTIQVGARDLIIRDHYELYTHCNRYGIKHLFYMGFATDQCILHRRYGMVRMTELGLTCAMIRDLSAHHITDIHYTTEEAAELIAQYIEQHIGPTLLSHQVYLQGENEHGI